MNFLRENGKSIREDDNSFKFILIDKNSGRNNNNHKSNQHAKDLNDPNDADRLQRLRKRMFWSKPNTNTNSNNNNNTNSAMTNSVLADIKNKPSTADNRLVVDEQSKSSSSRNLADSLSNSNNNINSVNSTNLGIRNRQSTDLENSGLGDKKRNTNNHQFESNQINSSQRSNSLHLLNTIGASNSNHTHHHHHMASSLIKSDASTSGAATSAHLSGSTFTLANHNTNNNNNNNHSSGHNYSTNVHSNIGLATLKPFYNKLKRPHLFGVKLEKLCGAYTETNYQLPAQLVNLLEKVAAEGPNSLMIFRKSASAKLKKLYREKLDAQQTVDYNDMNVHIAALLLKEYLRDYPDGLIDYHSYNDCLAILKLNDSKLKLKAANTLLLHLPRWNYACLKHFMCLFCCIASNSSVNKMDTHNIAVCVAPSLFHKIDKPSDVESSFQTIAFVRYLIENCEQLFGPDTFGLLKSVKFYQQTTERANLKTPPPPTVIVTNASVDQLEPDSITPLTGANDENQKLSKQSEKQSRSDNSTNGNGASHKREIGRMLNLVSLKGRKLSLAPKFKSKMSNAANLKQTPTFYTSSHQLESPKTTFMRNSPAQQAKTNMDKLSRIASAIDKAIVEASSSHKLFPQAAPKSTLQTVNNESDEVARTPNFAPVSSELVAPATVSTNENNSNNTMTSRIVSLKQAPSMMINHQHNHHETTNVSPQQVNNSNNNYNRLQIRSLNENNLTINESTIDLLSHTSASVSSSQHSLNVNRKLEKVNSKKSKIRRRTSTNNSNSDHNNLVDLEGAKSDDYVESGVIEMIENERNFIEDDPDVYVIENPDEDEAFNPEEDVEEDEDEDDEDDDLDVEFELKATQTRQQQQYDQKSCKKSAKKLNSTKKKSTNDQLNGDKSQSDQSKLIISSINSNFSSTDNCNQMTQKVYFNSSSNSNSLKNHANKHDLSLNTLSVDSGLSVPTIANSDPESEKSAFNQNNMIVNKSDDNNSSSNANSIHMAASPQMTSKNDHYHHLNGSIDEEDDYYDNPNDSIKTANSMPSIVVTSQQPTGCIKKHSFSTRRQEMTNSNDSENNLSESKNSCNNNYNNKSLKRQKRMLTLTKSNVLDDEMREEKSMGAKQEYNQLFTQKPQPQVQSSNKYQKTDQLMKQFSESDALFNESLQMNQMESPDLATQVLEQQTKEMQPINKHIKPTSDQIYNKRNSIKTIAPSFRNKPNPESNSNYSTANFDTKNLTKNVSKDDLDYSMNSSSLNGVGRTLINTNPNYNSLQMDKNRKLLKTSMRRAQSPSNADASTAAISQDINFDATNLALSSSSLSSSAGDHSQKSCSAAEKQCCIEELDNRSRQSTSIQLNSSKLLSTIELGHSVEVGVGVASDLKTCSSVSLSSSSAFATNSKEKSTTNNANNSTSLLNESYTKAVKQAHIDYMNDEMNNEELEPLVVTKQLNEIATTTTTTTTKSGQPEEENTQKVASLVLKIDTKVNCKKHSFLIKKASSKRRSSKKSTLRTSVYNRREQQPQQLQLQRDASSSSSIYDMSSQTSSANSIASYKLRNNENSSRLTSVKTRCTSCDSTSDDNDAYTFTNTAGESNQKQSNENRRSKMNSIRQARKPQKSLSLRLDDGGEPPSALELKLKNQRQIQRKSKSKRNSSSLKITKMNKQTSILQTLHHPYNHQLPTNPMEKFSHRMNGGNWPLTKTASIIIPINGVDYIEKVNEKRISLMSAPRAQIKRSISLRGDSTDKRPFEMDNLKVFSSPIHKDSPVLHSSMLKLIVNSNSSIVEKNSKMQPLSSQDEETNPAKTSRPQRLIAEHHKNLNRLSIENRARQISTIVSDSNSDDHMSAQVEKRPKTSATTANNSVINIVKSVRNNAHQVRQSLRPTVNTNVVDIESYYFRNSSSSTNMPQDLTQNRNSFESIKYQMDNNNNNKKANDHNLHRVSTFMPESNLVEVTWSVQNIRKQFENARMMKESSSSSNSSRNFIKIQNNAIGNQSSSSNNNNNNTTSASSGITSIRVTSNENDQAQGRKSCQISFKDINGNPTTYI